MQLFGNNLQAFHDFFSHYLPVKNPVLILALTLLIILFAPLILKRFRIPGIIGLIIAGVIIGPNTLHIIEKSTSFELFSKTGLLYIMFLAGLEIDMQEYKQNRSKSLVFGAFTFFIPITIGYLVCVYVFHYSLWPSLLLASMFSTHTLLSYPIVSNMGIVKNRAVQVSFGGTIITDSAVLILLGVITNVVQGEINVMFWTRLILSLALLSFAVLYLLPKVSRWFFRNIEGQGSSQYIYVLAVVFIAGYFSELAGVEPIIGAFLAGLALNRVIPHNSVLMNRVIFIGNTIFIPFFLISAGMLVDFSLFFKGTNALIFAGVLSVVALLTKWLAAQVTGFIYKYTKYERRVMFGLSASHAAATLAVIKVGYDIGLFDQNVINGTIILILITCMVSSFVTERAARKIAMSEKESSKKIIDRTERILIPVSNPENIARLIDLALIIKDNESHEPIYPLSIVEESADADEKIHVVKKVIEGIVEQIASVDKRVEVLKKVDLSIVDGIARTARAYSISDILISWKAQQGTGSLIFGSIADNLLVKTKQSIIISKVIQPLNTYRRVILLLSPNAELESGFNLVARKINAILKQLGGNAKVYGQQKTLTAFSTLIKDRKREFYNYLIVDSFDDSDILDHVKEDDLYIFLSSRKQTVSFDYHVDNMPKILNKNNESTSFVLFYPESLKALSDSQITEMTTPAFSENIEKVIQLKDKIKGIFTKD
jgi:Kef-type K+ transport system membrane component KefB/nucleotide-binding universal stress UspA family protein